MHVPIKKILDIAATVLRIVAPLFKKRKKQ